MWQKNIKKTVFTLNVDNYAPEITRLTYPLIRYYANKIGADFHIINTRKFPDMPPVYEKLQIYELAQEMGNDWNIYIDSDALIHPETPDFTAHLSKDTVMHQDHDMASVRWKYDRFFLRDGRNIGSCNWFAVASDWCIDLWKPLDDLTFEECLGMINPTPNERNGGIEPGHLIDDFTLSRNIAKYGLKYISVQDMLKKLGIPGAGFFEHKYAITNEAKVASIQDTLVQWCLPKEILNYANP